MMETPEALDVLRRAVEAGHFDGSWAGRGPTKNRAKKLWGGFWHRGWDMYWSGRDLRVRAPDGVHYVIDKKCMWLERPSY